MRFNLLLTIVLCLLLAAAGHSQRIELLETGQFHGDEVTASTGEVWQALEYRAGKFTFLTQAIIVEVVHDEIVDSPGEMTGKVVRTESGSQPRLLVKGGGLLDRSDILSVLSEERSADGRFNFEFRMGSTPYRLFVDNGERQEEYIGKGSRLLLVSGDRKQVLADLDEGANDANWAVLWVGDLDNDGKPDVYADVSSHYNVSDRRLFLSSHAVKGQFVGEAANFVTVGC